MKRLLDELQVDPNPERTRLRKLVPYPATIFPHVARRFMTFGVEKRKQRQADRAKGSQAASTLEHASAGAL